MENLISKTTPHEMSEEIASILASRASTDNLDFFRIIVSYYLANLASSMGTTVYSALQNSIPTNVYALALAPSGFGKGTSIGVMEREVTNKFREVFMNYLVPILEKEAPDRLALNASEYLQHIPLDTLTEKFKEQLESAGNYVPSFDEATVPAIKQLRTKIQLLGAGALNLEIDELGSNIQKSAEALKTYLELYDIGQIKTKLIKNTKENVRGMLLNTPSPANLLMFGTPSSLLNSDKEEELFMQFLEAGYARRCLFGYQDTSITASKDISIDDLYDILQTRRNDYKLTSICDHLGTLAGEEFLHRSIHIPTAVDKLILRYKLFCQDRASKFKSYQTIHTHEMQHRHFKATKLAGTYAFIDKRFEMNEKDFLNAIYLVEQSGNALHRILKRDKPAILVCKYIEEAGTSVTVSDLTDHLPFYKAASGQVRNDLMKEAKAWGHSNNIMVQEYKVNDITFYKGEKLTETSLSQITLSVSQDITTGFQNIVRDFRQLPQLFKSSWNWCSHQLKHGDSSKGHRANENCIQGCKLLVLDIDDTSMSPSLASELIKQYYHIIYTTKSNEKEAGVYCYRVIIPTNYSVNLDEDDFKKFMESAATAFPFTEVDVKTFNRTRLWFCNPDTTLYTNFEGELQLFNVVPHIPKTVQNIEYTSSNKRLGNVSAIERYFLNMMQEGNRNHSLLRYGLMLLDSEHSLSQVEASVLALNKKLHNPLNQKEIEATVFKTLAKKTLNNNPL